MDKPNLIETVIINDVKAIMKQCDQDTDREFLKEFGAYRNEVVYNQPIVTAERFDELCDTVLDS